MFRTIAIADGGELLFDETWLSAAESTSLLDILYRETPWQHETIVIAGRRIMQPRLTAWYGDPGTAYTYSGLTVHPREWTPALRDLRARTETTAGRSFNSVLLNLYRDGNDAMGLHADDEKELGKDPVIASVSLGAARRFVLRHKRREPRIPDVTLDLPGGSLLVMAGTTQSHWKHGVPRTKGMDGMRINLTFRSIHEK